MQRDPYRYYRVEARELSDGLERGARELEAGTADSDVCGRLLRVAHTLKGASRVVRLGRVAELAHAFEDVLAPHRESGVVPAESAGELLRLSAAIAAELATIRAPSTAAAPEEQRPRQAGATVDTVRVDIAELDRLLDGLAELRAGLERLRRDVRSADLRQRVERTIGSALDRFEAGLEAVTEHAGDLRLVPASTVLGALETAAADAARALGKRVELVASGAETRIDAHVLGPVRDALLHLVRNAVGHGVEPQAERLAAGKAPLARIELIVERRGHRVSFTCRDDGAGIDVAAVGRAAVERGTLDPTGATTLDLAGAVRLLRGGGLSTAASVTELSGRGVGLEVVREVVARLRGELRIDSRRGDGTTVELVVPLSLSSLATLMVEAAGAVLCLPVAAVQAAVRIDEADIARSPEGDAVVHDGEVVPFISLGQAFDPTAPARPGSSRRTTLIVVSRSGRVAVGVDRLLGVADAVVRPLPEVLGRVPLVSGAVLDADGHPRPFVDPDDLLATARAGRGRDLPIAPAPRRRVLVVDDSLTTRMLEKNILELAGYDVDLAVSGEEALERVRSRRYDALVVDVEMPGMSGFELIARTRSEPSIAGTPAVLVSSRASAEDKKRGMEVGARAYIVKGEFEQTGFLRTLAALTGPHE